MGMYIVAAGFLSIPILSVGLRRLFHVGKFLKGEGGEVGNIQHPLSLWQVFGIWPSGDFRDSPTSPTVTHLLGALVLVGVILAVVMAWRRGRWEVVAALATAVFACLVYVGTATTWVASKALASSSPLVLGVALVGVAAAIEGVRRVEVGGAAMAMFAVIAGGVLLSNVMQYHAVILAPSDRLMELEHIGSKYSGQGPGLLTEFEPYGARHFLRGLGGEATSELRVNPVCLRPGSPLPDPESPTGCIEAAFGTTPNVDEIKLDQVLHYRTLITRRTGVESRPPSVYRRVWAGRYYDVWQRGAGKAPDQIIKHVSLGSRFQPAAVPDCQKVMDLADRASAFPHGVLAAVVRSPAIVIEGDGKSELPKDWFVYGQTRYLYTAPNAYTRTWDFKVPSLGSYGVWVGGSFNSTLTMSIDGRVVGRRTNETQWPGNFLSFGSAVLTRGTHHLGIRHSGPGLGPGTGAQEPFGAGPFVVTQSVGPNDITYIEPSKARSRLCGKSLDWVEALRHR